ncbi:MAG: toprim domain-containing protein [Thiomicrospira sp.]|jgi:putative DNA primase/helicase
MNAPTLAEFMALHGYDAPPSMCTGEIIRFNAPGKPKGNKSAWLKVFGDGAAMFGNWITGEEHVYQPNGLNELDQAQRAAAYLQMQAERAKHQAELMAQYARMADKAAGIWESLPPASEHHPYLLAKQIQPHGAAFMPLFDGYLKDCLIIPIYGELRGGVLELISLQAIDPTGTKRPLKGAKFKGGFYPVQWLDNDAPIVICEGFATAATMAEHYTQAANVICAFNAQNLVTVAKYLRQRHHGNAFYIAADNDRFGETNTGLVMATKAARLCYGEILFPEFKEGEAGTDWNDFYQLQAQRERMTTK